MDTETKQSEKTPQSRVEEILKQIINPQTEENGGGNENEGGNN